jgi:hypothetical protein
MIYINTRGLTITLAEQVKKAFICKMSVARNKIKY